MKQFKFIFASLMALYQRCYTERLYFLFVTYLIISRYRKA